MDRGTFELLAQGRVRTLPDWDELIGCSYDGTRLESARQTCGGRLDRLRFGDIRIARIMAEPHRVRRWHQGAPSRPAGVTYLHLQESGRSITNQRGKETLLDAGMAAFCDPNENYSIEFPESYRVYLIEIPDALLAPSPETSTPSGEIVPGRARLLHGVVGQIFGQMPYLGDEPDWAEAVHGALASLLRHLVPAALGIQPTEGVSVAMRAAVLRKIEQHVTDPDLSVGAIAQALRVSRRSVQRVFAASYGSASAYILNRRLCMAAERLASNARRETITGVAMACGFTDAAYFARCFRARFGRTPSAFRRAPGATGVEASARKLLSDLS